MRIKNKKQFTRAMITILLTIVSILLVTLFMENLKAEGLGSLFSIPAYEEGFKVNETDIKIINVWEISCIGTILFMAYTYLDYYSKIAQVEAEEQRVLKNV